MMKKNLFKIVLGTILAVLVSLIVVLTILLVNEKKKESPTINAEITTYKGVVPNFQMDLILSDSKGVIDKEKVTIIVDDSEVNYDVVGKYSVIVKVIYEKKTYSYVVQVDVLPKKIVISKSIVVVSIGDENVDWVNLIDVKDYLGNKVVDVEVDLSNVNLTKEGKYIIKVTATDKEGNVGTQNVELRVTDLRPTLEFKKGFSSPILYEVGSDFDLNFYLRARDNKGTDVSYSIKFLDKNVLFNTVGIYSTRVGCEDNDGRISFLEIEIKVIPKEEDQRPILSGIKESFLTMVGNEISDEELLEGVTAHDAYGDLTSEIKLNKEKVNFYKDGIYQVYYTVTNSLENPLEFTTTGITTIEVVEADYEGPVLEFDSETLYVEVNIISNLLEGVTCYDLLDKEISIDSIEITPSEIDFSVLGEHRLKYSVNDRFGNNTYKFRNLVIRDTTKPVISGLDEIITTTRSDSWTYDAIKQGIIVNDNYDGNITNQLKILYGDVNILEDREVANEIFTNIGEYNLVYQVTDSSGNKTIKEVILNVTWVWRYESWKIILNILILQIKYLK